MLGNEFSNLLTFVDRIGTHRKLADLCGSELSAAQLRNLLTSVDHPNSAQRSAETC